MDTVTIDRLHARYEDVPAEAVERFDAALADLARRALDQELMRLSTGPRFAVCIREIVVPVSLDATKPIGAVAAAWARLVADEIIVQLTIATDPVGSPRAAAQDGAALVYRRETDAYLDMATSLSRSDRTRAWAWRQMGLTTTSSPTVTELIAALERRIELLPSVLGAMACPWDLPLAADQWSRLARAFARLPGVASHSVTTGSEPGLSFGPDSQPTRPRRPAAGSTNGTARAPAPLIPEAALPRLRRIWSETDPKDRDVFVSLLLALFRPGAAHDHVARDAVARQLDERTTDRDEPGSSPSLRSGATELPADVPVVDSAIAEPAPGDDERPADTVAGAEPDAAASRMNRVDGIRSRFGGVLFLLHVLDATGVPELLQAEAADGGDATEALARVVSCATGVPIGDPVVRTVAGLEPGYEGEIPDTDGGAGPDSKLIDRCVSAVVASLDERFADEPTHADWLWERDVRIEWAPGWIEAELDIDHVDLRVRRAGLDLDPGFVWWLGAVVRFRYV